MTIIKKLLYTLPALAIVFALASCGGDQAAEKTPADQPADNTSADVQSTDAAPAVAFTAYDIDGKLRTSSEWIGKQPVVVNFWGSWCPPCRKEIPDLVKLYDEYRPKGVEILGVAVKDTPQSVESFAKKNKMDWVMLMADDGVVSQFQPLRGVPTTIFLDKQGNEIGRFVGPPSYDQFKEAFDALLETS